MHFLPSQLISFFALSRSRSRSLFLPAVSIDPLFGSLDNAAVRPPLLCQLIQRARDFVVKNLQTSWGNLNRQAAERET